MAENIELNRHMEELCRQCGILDTALTRKGEQPTASMKRSLQDFEHDFSRASKSKASTALTIHSNIMGHPYAPCTLPLASLSPLYLRDLRLETHHRGRVLVVRPVLEPRSRAAIENVVEDENGDVDLLCVYHLLPDMRADRVLPKGAVVAIKEPYYQQTVDGGVAIRVDHPSDLLLLHAGHPIVPACWKSPDGEDENGSNGETQRPKTLKRLKKHGNTAFRRGDSLAAVDLYSEALELIDATRDSSSDDRVKFDLLRNRAAAQLRLGRLEPALADALASVLPSDDENKEVNVKALFRAATAAYGLQDFVQAKQHLLRIVSALDPRNKESQELLARTERRLEEQEHGTYDFMAMSKSATFTHRFLDHASFLKRTRIGVVDHIGGGRGLFAAEDIAAGEVVLVEKALFVAHSSKEMNSAFPVVLDSSTNRVFAGTHCMRFYGVLDKVLWNPTLAKRYMSLWAGTEDRERTDAGTGTDKSAACVVVDGRVAIDAFRAQAIAEVNGFGAPKVKTYGDKDEEETTLLERMVVTSGIWVHASYLNHSCVGNADRSFIGDIIIIRAQQPIPAGTEICMPYLNLGLTSEERRRRLQNGYGFSCACPLCRAETQDSDTALTERVRLQESVLPTLRSLSPSSRLAQAKILLASLRATYSASYYAHLPRVACYDVASFVADSAKTTAEKREGYLGLLRDLGYDVKIHADEDMVEVEYLAPVSTLVVVKAAKEVAACLRASKQPKAAKELEKLAKCAYLVANASEEGWVET